MTDYKQLCAELVEKLDELNCHYNVPNQSAMIERAHDALAQPEPEGPTDEEVDVWVDQQGFIRGHGDHPCGFWIDDDDAGALVRAALARWGGQGAVNRPFPSEPDTL